MLQNRDLSVLFDDKNSEANTLPIWVVEPSDGQLVPDGLSTMQSAWIKNNGWKASQGKSSLIPDENGSLAGIVYAHKLNEEAPLKFGNLVRQVPDGHYEIKSEEGINDIEVLSWFLSQYSYERYKTKSEKNGVSLKLPAGVDRERMLAVLEAVYLGRDLINTPPNDMGPDELEDAAQELAKLHGAQISVVRGDDLLEENYPLIHAVGRASTRAPRLIDISWGTDGHVPVTLVGKGICFDTGGLNIKPGAGMTLMKKDMGGAATVLALAHMIMSQKLSINLRVILAVAENSISGNAFRPGDVIPSRNGMTVEIGNTDAEGRLVLADALALADEKEVDHIMTFATLTGAARVALGVDLPPFYTTREDFAIQLQKASMAVGDPLWRMPFWEPYDTQLKSAVADVSHISDSMFGGSITAGLFLKRFVRNANDYSHFDIYGWCPGNKPGKVKGGEPQGARAVFEVFEQLYPR